MYRGSGTEQVDNSNSLNDLEVSAVSQDPRRTRLFLIGLGSFALLVMALYGVFRKTDGAAPGAPLSSPLPPNATLDGSPSVPRQSPAREAQSPALSSLPPGTSLIPGNGEKIADVPTAIAVPKDGCVDLRFKAEGKEVTRYAKNRLAVSDERLNPKTLCVRVDGVPVKHQWEPSKREIVFGAVAKVSSQVSVRYCYGQAKCGDACLVPRDEFMEALAGVADDTAENAAPVGWTGSKEESAAEQNVERELAAFSEVTEDRLPGTYAKWKSGDPAPSCAAGAR